MGLVEAIRMGLRAANSIRQLQNLVPEMLDTIVAGQEAFSELAKAAQDRKLTEEEKMRIADRIEGLGVQAADTIREIPTT
jgi:formiminotetrahydrofolate cyclodeaminase